MPWRRQLMVNVIVVDAVIDELALSVPVMVTVYVPFDAIPDEDEEPEEPEAELEHPELTMPAAIRSNEHPARLNF